MVQAAPELANAVTYYGKVPSSWLPINCIVDTPPPTPYNRRDHCRIVEVLMTAMSKESLKHVTGRNGTAIHTLVAHGQSDSLNMMVQIYAARLTADEFADVLNYKAGLKKRGVKDVVICFLQICFVIG